MSNIEHTALRMNADVPAVPADSANTDLPAHLAGTDSTVAGANPTSPTNGEGNEAPAQETEDELRDYNLEDDDGNPPTPPPDINQDTSPQTTGAPPLAQQDNPLEGRVAPTDRPLLKTLPALRAFQLKLNETDKFAAIDLCIEKIALHTADRTVTIAEKALCCLEAEPSHHR